MNRKLLKTTPNLDLFMYVDQLLADASFTKTVSSCAQLKINQTHTPVQEQSEILLKTYFDEKLLSQKITLESYKKKTVCKDQGKYIINVV